MDFIGPKFQGKQRHVLLFLEPLDDWDLRNPCGCLRAELLGRFGKSRPHCAVDSSIFAFWLKDDVKSSRYFNFFPQLLLLPEKPEGDK